MWFSKIICFQCMHYLHYWPCPFLYLVLDPISRSSLIKKFCFVALNFLIFWVWDRQAIEGNEISQIQWNSLQSSLKVLHFSSGARKWPGLLYPYKKRSGEDLAFDVPFCFVDYIAFTLQSVNHYLTKTCYWHVFKCYCGWIITVVFFIFKKIILLKKVE